MILEEIRPRHPQFQLERLERYQATHQFHQEVQYRQDYDRHCQWYQCTAKQHQQELQALRRDVNVLRWFRRAPS